MNNGKLTQLFKDIVSNSMEQMFKSFDTNLESGKDKISVSLGEKDLQFRELLVNFGVKIGRLGNLENGFIQNYLASDKTSVDRDKFIENFNSVFWDGLGDTSINKKLIFKYEDKIYTENIDTISSDLSNKFLSLVDKYPNSFFKDKSSWIPLLIETNQEDSIVTDCRFYDELEFFNKVNDEIFPIIIRKIDPITENGFVYDSNSKPNSKLIDFEVLKQVYLDEIKKDEYKHLESFKELETFKNNFKQSVEDKTSQIIGPAEIDSAILSIALNINDNMNINNNVQNIIVNSYKKLGLIDYKNYLGVSKELFSNNETVIDMVDKLTGSSSDKKMLLFIGNSQNGKDTIFNLLNEYIKDFSKDIKLKIKISNENNELIYPNILNCEATLAENPLRINIKTTNISLPESMLNRLNEELSQIVLSEISFKDLANYEDIFVEIAQPIYFQDLYTHLKDKQKLNSITIE